MGWIILIVILVIWYAVYKMPGGCEGDCQQGRKECNCKRVV